MYCLVVFFLFCFFARVFFSLFPFFFLFVGLLWYDQMAEEIEDRHDENGWYLGDYYNFDL